MNKVKQTHIGMKNHNIATYLEISLKDFISGKQTPNDEYEITNYLGKSQRKKTFSKKNAEEMK